MGIETCLMGNFLKKSEEYMGRRTKAQVEQLDKVLNYCLAEHCLSWDDPILLEDYPHIFEHLRLAKFLFRVHANSRMLRFLGSCGAVVRSSAVSASDAA